MNDSETTRNLSAGVSALLGSMGYVVAPEVDYERMKTSRNAKVMLRFEVVRMGGACFITAKAAELKTQSIFFWRWETKDDSKACAEQLKASVEEYFKARAPSKLPPGADAGVDLDGGLEKAMAKVVLPLTLVEPEMAPLAPAGPDASDRVDAAAPPAPTKKCGCGESGAPMAAAALLAALALRRRLSLV
jgi:hypothetical protein